MKQLHDPFMFYCNHVELFYEYNGFSATFGVPKLRFKQSGPTRREAYDTLWAKVRILESYNGLCEMIDDEKSIQGSGSKD